MSDEERLEELIEEYESGDIDVEQMAYDMWKKEKAMAALQRKLDAVQKLVTDATKVHAVFPNEIDRIWIDCVEAALETE